MVSNETELKELGDLLRDRRKELKLSTRELSEKVGISPAYLWMLEKGTNPKTGRSSRPSYDVLAKLDSALNLGSRAYELAGYGYRKESVPPTQLISEISQEWKYLLDSYIVELRRTFKSLGEGRRGKMLEDISRVVKRYKPESSMR